MSERDATKYGSRVQKKSIIFRFCLIFSNNFQKRNKIEIFAEIMRERERDSFDVIEGLLPLTDVSALMMINILGII